VPWNKGRKHSPGEAQAHGLHAPGACMHGGRSTLGCASPRGAVSTCTRPLCRSFNAALHSAHGCVCNCMQLAETIAKIREKTKEAMMRSDVMVKVQKAQKPVPHSDEVKVRGLAGGWGQAPCCVQARARAGVPERSCQVATRGWPPRSPVAVALGPAPSATAGWWGCPACTPPPLRADCALPSLPRGLQARIRDTLKERSVRLKAEKEAVSANAATGRTHSCACIQAPTCSLQSPPSSGCRHVHCTRPRRPKLARGGGACLASETWGPQCSRAEGLAGQPAPRGARLQATNTARRLAGQGSITWGPRPLCHPRRPPDHRQSLRQKRPWLQPRG
jgi:hypothetical protein